MPTYVSNGWKVKKPFSELLPEVDALGELKELSADNTKANKKRQKL